MIYLNFFIYFWLKLKIIDSSESGNDILCGTSSLAIDDLCYESYPSSTMKTSKQSERIEDY